MSIESSREREEIQFLCAKVYDVESIERGGSHEAGIVEAESVGQNPREVVQQMSESFLRPQRSRPRRLAPPLTERQLALALRVHRAPALPLSLAHAHLLLADRRRHDGPAHLARRLLPRGVPRPVSIPEPAPGHGALVRARDPHRLRVRGRSRRDRGRARRLGVEHRGRAAAGEEQLVVVPRGLRVRRAHDRERRERRGRRRLRCGLLLALRTPMREARCDPVQNARCCRCRRRCHLHLEPGRRRRVVRGGGGDGLGLHGGRRARRALGVPARGRVDGRAHGRRGDRERSGRARGLRRAGAERGRGHALLREAERRAHGGGCAGDSLRGARQDVWLAVFGDLGRPRADALARVARPARARQCGFVDAFLLLLLLLAVPGLGGGCDGGGGGGGCPRLARGSLCCRRHGALLLLRVSLELGDTARAAVDIGVGVA